MGLDFSLPSVEAFLLDALSRLRWPHGDLARLLAVSVQGSPWRDAAGTGWPPVSLRDLVSDVKTVLLVILAFVAPACGGPAVHSPRVVPVVIPIADGWRTEHIVATVYNARIGLTIRVVFPGHPFEADDQRLFAFLEREGGGVYEGGGYAGAPLHAIYPGVQDRAAADRFLKRVLPEYEAYVQKELGW